ncbi:MAG: hypothetical protein KC729_05155 [Candidatus Eisenbacteria bacterium]|uniref:Rhodanese domain-containing protein n=1 Tax=Eiseniibacteriota bacterium TaxID=2212470 RepID=A0A956LX86_UNCEI|nr:hypothetical protein [Candidatus Eisenbacteria bacterium]
MRIGDRLPVLDVRTRRDFLLGHVPGAVHRPENRLLDEPYLLPPRHRRFLVMGRNAEHEAAVVATLRHAGWIGAEPGEFAERARPGPLEEGPDRGRLWEPSPFLAEVAPHLPVQGDVVDLACGSGRNAVYLGLRRMDSLPSPARDKPTATDLAGGTVFGIDVLPDALRLARRLRRASGCGGSTVRFDRADLTDARAVRRWLPPSRYAVITCFRYLDRALLPAIEIALAPGGVVVYETFLVAQRDRHGKPRSPEFLLHPGELRRAFASLEIVEYREGEDAEGNILASLLARRS